MTCRRDRFTVPTPETLKGTLARKLIPVADRLRDLRVRFGLRPYEVLLVRTRWTGGSRGVGAEELISELRILPTPLVSDLSALGEISSPVGLIEAGGVLLSEVSGAYTEQQLRGLADDGTEPQPDENVFYEVAFIGETPVRRRFSAPRSAPHYDSDRFQWTLRLERAIQDRDPYGELR